MIGATITPVEFLRREGADHIKALEAKRSAAKHSLQIRV
jgi:hypothetical protein